jgi:uncharacterized damage-inducible protein DinB
MVRTIQDFLEQWKTETESTLKIFNNLTDASLQTAIPGGRTLGRLVNHLVETLTELPHKLGLPIQEDFTQYTTVADLIAAYTRNADQVAEAVENNWNDYTLLQEQAMYNGQWKNGLSLYILIIHQTHHRGQMTVLMRMAGLKVPGLYGPAKEEWEAWGQEALA